MRCGLDCMHYLLKYYGYNEETSEKMLEEAKWLVGKKGMSIYDFIRVMKANHLVCRAFKSIWMPKQLPCVLYMKSKNKSGHYIILVERNKFHFIIYDPLVKYKKINKIWLYIFWSHICILCYNDTKRGT